jgi:hypothetical protein
MEALLDALSPASRATVLRALRRKLAGRPDKAQDRVDELGALADMLCAIGAPVNQLTPPLQRDVYDQDRPRRAPSSEVLVDRYGSWRKVRRAAHGLLDDGRWTGPGRPWPGHVPPPRYSRDEVRSAMRRCVLALGVRHLPVEVYLAWRRARGVEYARAQRLPAYGAIRRHYTTWRAAAADVPVSGLELVRARALLLPTAPAATAATGAHAQLFAMPPDLLTRLGVSRDDIESGLGHLSLSVAGELARMLGGSVHWLAGRDEERGSPPTAPVRFDPVALRRLRRDRVVADSTVRQVAGYASGPWRAVLTGTRSPDLGVCCRIAELLGVAVDDLCRTWEPRTVPSSEKKSFPA